MKAVILAGGFGTRLRPLTCTLPKPMVPVANRPVLEHTLNLLKRHGITEVVFLLLYLPERIQEHFGDGSRFGMRFHYVVAEQDVGTAGAARLAAPWCRETSLLVSGDAVTDLDLTTLVEFHRHKQALLTVALARTSNPSPFGIAITDREGRITRFLEKPSAGQVFSDAVNMGIYVLEPEVFDLIPTGEACYFARDLFPQLLKEGHGIFGCTQDAYWKDIGDLRAYREVHQDMLAQRLRLDLPVSEKDGLWLGDGCKIDRHARVEGPVILGRNVRIAADVRLRQCVIGDDCVLGEGTNCEQAILWDGVHVGAACELRGCVVAARSVLEEACRLGENVAIGEHVHLGPQARVNPEVKIWPHKEVEAGSVVNASVVWGDRWRRELFSDSRVSGLANFEVSPEFSARLGTAFGIWVGKGQEVVVSRDPTPAARMVYRAIVSGLLSSGVHVQNLQLMPIPIVRYSVHHTRARAGVYVRRSPFEREVMDVLFFDAEGRDLRPGTRRAIERLFFREDFPRVTFDEVGQIDYPVRVAQGYVQDFLTHVDTEAINARQPNFVLDYSHGAATEVFPSLLGHLSCEVVALNAVLEPHKLTRNKAEFEAALEHVAELVGSTKAELGCLMDAGGEKIFCVSERGQVIPGWRLAVLVTRLALEISRPKKIAVPVSASILITELAEEYGAQLVYTADEPAALIQATEDEDVGFAADNTGGFIFPPFQPAYDGMFSLVKVLELLAKAGTTLEQLDHELPLRALVTAEIPCPWEVKGAVMRELDRETEREKRLLVDGIKVFLEDGWVLVTPHREKAYYRIVAEAGKKARAGKLVRAFERKIQNWIEMLA